MIIYLLIALLFTYFALSYDKFDSKSHILMAWIAFFILFVVAGFRGRYVDVDYVEAYEYFISKIPDANFMFDNFSAYLGHIKHAFQSPPELSFCFIVSLLKEFGQTVMPAVAVIYAFFGVTLKIKALQRLSDDKTFGYALLFYFANLFLLQEMTQIRVGVATALILLAIPSIVNRQFSKFFFLVLLASFIHRSSIIAFPFYFLSNNKINVKLWFGTLFVLMAMAVSKFDFISIILDYNVPILHDKMTNYIMMQDWLKFHVNLFNVFFLLQLGVTSLICYKRKLLALHCKYLFLFIKISILGMMCFYFFYRIPVFAFRLSDLLGSVTCLLYPLIYYVFRRKLVSQCFLVGMAWGILLVNLFHNGLLKPYYMIFFD